MECVLRGSFVTSLALLLGACGGGAAPTGEPSAAAGSAPAGTGWDPLDACAALGDGPAGAASGSPVTSSELQSVVKGGEGEAAFSSCLFRLANGGQLLLLTRKAPRADVDAAAVEAARTSGGTAPPAVDVPGLGKAALWSAQTGTLQVFADETHFLSVTYMGLPAGDDAKARAIAVAGKLM